MEKITEYLTRSTVHTSEVRAWEETVLLPTMASAGKKRIPSSWKNGCIREVQGRYILIL